MWPRIYSKRERCQGNSAGGTPLIPAAVEPFGGIGFFSVCCKGCAFSVSAEHRLERRNAATTARHPPRLSFH